MFNDLPEPIRKILQKPPRFWMRLIMSVSVGLFALYMVINFTFVVVDVKRHDGINDPVTLYGSRPGGVEGGIVAFGSLAIAHRDTISIRASTGTYQTYKSIGTLPLIGFKSVTINLYKDRDVKKYSGDNLGCTAYDKRSDVVLSYRCGKPENLVRYDYSTNGNQVWENKVVAKMTDKYPPIFSVQPFNNGVLGIIQPGQDNREKRDLLFYIDNSGHRQSFNLPVELESRFISATSIVTDNSSSSSLYFLVVAKSAGQLYLGEISGNNVTYKQYIMPESYNSILDAMNCSLLATVAYCYTGENSGHSDSQVEATYRKQEHPRLLRIIEFNTSQPTEKTFTINKDIPIDKLYVTRSNNIYSLVQNEEIEGDIYKLNITNTSSVSPQLILGGVSSISTGDGLLYIKNSAVYKVDDKTDESYLVFYSKHLRLSNLTVFGDSVFINAYVEGMPNQKIHTYRILNQASSMPHGQRTVDILPVYISGKTLDMDYVDNTVRVRVFANLITDKANNRVIYDEGDYANNRLFVENQLTNLGITPDKYNIIYSK